jgi:hypothetical protein
MLCDGLPEENYSFYILGNLSGQELAELEAHIRQSCERCLVELARARQIWNGVALAIPEIEPRRALRKRVVASVQDPERSGFHFHWWQPLTALAALSLAIFGGWQLGHQSLAPVRIVQILQPPFVTNPAIASLEKENQTLRNRLANGAALSESMPVAQTRPSDDSALLAEIASDRQHLAAIQQDLAQQKELVVLAQRNAEEANRKYSALNASPPKPETSDSQRQLAEAQTRTQELERDVAQYKSLLATARQRSEFPFEASALLADPNLKLVRLRGTAKGSDIEGHVLLSGGSRVIFYGSQLPSLPAGRAYQLWLIRATSPAIVSAGVFQPNAQKRATIRFDNAELTSGITAIAVTDEPEAGSLTPTGHKLLIGS